MNKSYRAGFSLIELMVTIVIVAILAVIAYPSYEEHVRKTRRSDGQGALLDLANRMERYYTRTNTYATATIDTDPGTDVLASADSTEGYYTLSITAQTATSYALQATPKSGTPQAHDARCGNLTLTSAGVKGASGPAGASECWRR